MLWLWVGAVLCLGLIDGSHVWAEEHVENFDTQQPTWKIRVLEGSLERVDQRRVTTGSVQGDGAEYFGFRVVNGPTSVIMDHKLPVARAISELKLKLVVRSTTNGATVGLRVGFPRQTDPRSGQPLKLVLRGETYTRTPKWQALEVGTAEKGLQEQMRLLRAKLKPTPLDLRDPVVDRIILELTLEAGETELFLDKLTFGPIVPPIGIANAKPSQTAEDSPAWPVTFQLDRLLVGGQPFFPRVLPFHGEEIDRLRDAGFNVIWIPEAGDVELQRSLKEQGLWATAVPPRVQSSKGETLRGDEA
ncbi:MAG TPA: hypothetical protein VK137_11450, partial [Planctomycetaceae bacterium]|nr:hypothetical protein [Planctomycetaceae bacterium]